jgi:hypothetical protein
VWIATGLAPFPTIVRPVDRATIAALIIEPLGASFSVGNRCENY